MPAEPNASKNADCGLITAAVPARAVTHLSANRASPAEVTGRPQAASSSGCGSMPTHTGPSSSSLWSAAPRMFPSRFSHGHPLPRGSLSVREQRITDGICERVESALVQGLLQFRQHSHRRGRIAENRRADRYRGRTREDEFERLQPGPDATHPENRQVWQGILAPATRTAPQPDGSPARRARR